MSRYSPTFTPSIHQCASPFAWSPVFTTSTTSQRCHSPRVRETAARFGVRLRAGTGVFCRRSCASSGPLPLPCSEKYTTGLLCCHTNPILLTPELCPCQLLDSFTQNDTYNRVYPSASCPSSHVDAGS